MVYRILIMEKTVLRLSIMGIFDGRSFRNETRLY